jgi:hypothetical protein
MADSHPAGSEASDAARWWRAYVLAENDQVDELRESAARGDDHARRQLADSLGDRDRTEEAIEVIRPLADAGDDVADLRRRSSSATSRLGVPAKISQMGPSKSIRT